MKTQLLIAGIAAGLALQFGAVQAQESPGPDRERPSFSELDLNGDGQLSQEELRAPAAARFAEADTNGDGALSVDELQAQASERMAERIANRAERMLERRDANGDGLLQQSELQEGRDGRGFARIDSDEDGFISEAEFDAAREAMKDRRGAFGHGSRDRG